MNTTTAAPDRLRRIADTGLDRSPRAVRWDIPVPPYDQVLPEEYWQSLGNQPVRLVKKRKTTTSIPWMEVWCWAKSILAVTAFLACVAAIFLHPQPSPFPVPEKSDPATFVNHIVLDHCDYWVDQEGYVHRDMIAGNDYWIVIPPPDNRCIKVHYKGKVPNFAALPKQPAGGASNACYIAEDTNTDWIWTVPIQNNVPQWIDP